MGNWQEYTTELNRVVDNIPYGGLIKSNVLRCKDDSYLGCIEFDRFLAPEDNVSVIFPEFRRGWNIWSEHQHIPYKDRYLVYFNWNPFKDKDNFVKNPLGKSKKIEDCDSYFQEQLENFSKKAGNFINCRILEYNDFLSALSYSLSFDLIESPKPEVPLYLDYYLTEGIDFKFYDNDIVLNNKKLIVVTLSSFPNPDITRTLYRAFIREKFRHVKRMLFMSDKEYTKEMRRYMMAWCQGRKSVKKFIADDIFPGEFHGLASENLIFITERDNKDLAEYIFDVMNALELPYILESFNLKDVWWGSLPGIFRANINPPAISMENIYEMLFPIEKPLLESEEKNVSS